MSTASFSYDYFLYNSMERISIPSKSMDAILGIEMFTTEYSDFLRTVNSSILSSYSTTQDKQDSNRELMDNFTSSYKNLGIRGREFDNDDETSNFIFESTSSSVMSSSNSDAMNFIFEFDAEESWMNES